MQALLLVLICLTVAQAPPSSAPPSREAIAAAARAIIEKAGFATFVSIDETGHPQARIVDPFAPDAGFTVWIATNARSRKVRQIEKEPRVSLVYFDTASSGAVTLIGTARLVRDAATKARYWKPAWKAFYTDENRGEDYVLIRVDASRLELSSPAHGMNNDPATWLPVVLHLK